MTQQQAKAYTLSEFNQLIANKVNYDPSLRGWVVAETADLRVNGGHCYLELIEKDERNNAKAKIRAAIWANVFRSLDAKFFRATSQHLASNLKVMMYVTASFHPAYGMCLVVGDIHPEYTLGDAMAKRRENIERLTAEGIINLNRELAWAPVPQRIAIISARGAAGYGDFVNQLFSNKWRLRFSAKLFPALMQGASAADSIIEALRRVEAEADHWQGVVIIRGGGATSDLACFESYDLAAAVARCPLPVIIGIGHERDITLLDYVANMRVKTPTAAAEWLIERGINALGSLQDVALQMRRAITDRLQGHHRQLALYDGQLPALASAIITRAQSRLAQARSLIASVASVRIAPQREKLRSLGGAIASAADVALTRAKQQLQMQSQLLSALSPEATLRRGYSITRVDGRAVTDASALRPGQTITTTFASGTATSTVNDI